jgi:hypothetical protein
MLDRLAEAGLEIAIALETRAKGAASAPADDPVDLDAVALGYSRVARAVRLSILLQSKLIADRDDAARARAERRAEAEARKANEPWDREELARDRVARILRRVIHAEHEDEDRIERLVAEACERVEDDDCYGSASLRPMSEMVADICKDLGLNPDWAAMAVESWAMEEMRSGAVGRPLSPIAAAMAGGGPIAERSEERLVEGESPTHLAPSSPVSDSS